MKLQPLLCLCCGFGRPVIKRAWERFYENQSCLELPNSFKNMKSQICDLSICYFFGTVHATAKGKGLVKVISTLCFLLLSSVLLG